MQILGLTISRTTKGAVAPIGPNSDIGWRTIYEAGAGYWQRNIVTRAAKNVLTHSAVYASVTLIAGDMGKLRLKLVEQDDDDIWIETESAAFSPVLRKPNRYQTRQQFIEQWTLSKLIHGNTYILLERDQRRVVVAMYILDPCRVKVLVTPDGSVFYQLHSDNLAGLEMGNVQVPASELIHDRMKPLYHPLCGVSPLIACALAACHGLNIQEHAATFFANGANPGGVLTAPGKINDETAARIKKSWEEKFTGVNVGRVAVLGDGLHYEAMAMNAVHSQLIEQLKWTAEQIATVFHIPPYMIGAGPPPAYNNIEALNTQYYAQCLQTLIEAIEALLDEALGLTAVEGKTLGTEFDLDDLLRMDTPTRVKATTDAIGGGLMAPNEGRKRFDLGPLPGGDSVYLQQQYFSLEALAKRDAAEDPFGMAKPEPPALPAPDDTAEEPPADQTLALVAAIRKKTYEKLAA